MNEFEDLLNSVSEVNPGDVVTAEVLTVDNDQANVVIEGTGVEGVLTLRELTNDRNADINDFVKTGDTVEVLVLRQVVGKDTDTVTFLVSKKRLEARKAWDKLVGREGEVVTVKGTRAVKGGLSVEFEGLRGFIPASMIDTRFVRNTEKFVGQADAYGYKTDLEVDAVSSATVRGTTFKNAYTKNEDGTQTVKTPVTGYTFDTDGNGHAITLEEDGGSYAAVCLFSFEYDGKNHVYDSGKVTTQPGCESEGVKTFTCSCGDSYTEAIAAVGHNYQDGTCENCGEADPDYVAPGGAVIPDQVRSESRPSQDLAVHHSLTMTSATV